MWETMYSSNGVGLAAPQVNRDIRLFVVDSQQIFNNLEEDEKDKYPDGPGIRQVFINAHVTGLNGEEWSYNEGCLSIPKIREDIIRSEEVTIEYVDEISNRMFRPLTASLPGSSCTNTTISRGKLFIDYLKPLKRKLLKGKLDDITKGKISVDY